MVWILFWENRKHTSKLFQPVVGLSLRSASIGVSIPGQEGGLMERLDLAVPGAALAWRGAIGLAPGGVLM
jgi:hypothetical protein